METFADALSQLFYGATLASLLFFLHKVFWLVKYKAIQRELVGSAVARLRDGNEPVIGDWEDFARTRWQTTLGQAEVSGPSTFVRRVEQGLGRLRADMTSSRKSIENLLARSLAGVNEAGDETTVLSLRRLTTRGTEERYEVALGLTFPGVAAPRPPDKRLYELKVKSRYGIWRRALVFFSGAADVVYSSHHVALMSQNVHVPTSLLARRLSLVFLVLAVVLVDFTFGARRWLTTVMNAWLHPPAVHAANTVVQHDVITDNLGSVLAFGIWLAAYGAIYIALYLWIRRRYQGNVYRLRKMLADEKATMDAIYLKHTGDLVRWGRNYGRSLDSAVDLTMRHAETLVDHYAHRLRRRLAAASLLDGAKVIADSLFLRLPESRGDVQDVATAHRHSFRHYLWPRADEMEYQVRLAQYRAAWQHLELSINAMRSERPDPNQAHDLWQSAFIYATLFAPLVATGAADDLRHAYAQMVTECVAQTDRDLADLDRRVGALHASLRDQIDCARALVESKIELANQQVQAAVAALSAEIINLREQARLEAMAFEI